MTVNAKVVKKLRQKTGAGIMDCKEALTITNGDIDSAVEVLRKKGIAKAEKKVGRKADQGSVVAYIHPGNRVGVLVEINCETDFVAKTDSFHGFAKNIAMQVAAANPLTVSREQVDNVIIEKERNIYFEQAKSLGKPEKVLDKIVEGKIEKFYQEKCLLEQPFIKDNDKTVQDILTETVASLGENISISRFTRYEVGEGLVSNGEG
jgi:elongation factor Ts